LLTSEMTMYNNRRLRAWQHDKRCMGGSRSKFADRIASTLELLTEKTNLRLIFLSPPVNEPGFSISKSGKYQLTELTEIRTIILTAGNDRKIALDDRTYKEIDRKLTESFYIKGLPLSVVLSVLSDIHQRFYFLERGFEWKS
jgi:hypothetical protein